MLEEKVKNYLYEILPTEYFVIDVIFKKSKINSKLNVLLDGDKGISIDICAEISRKLGAWLDEQNLIENAYNLEVSSPGVDLPLQFMRQYPQHIGRTLEITNLSDEKIQGKLVEVKSNENQIVIQPIPTKKLKKGEVVLPITLNLNQIKKTFVTISFK
jgi:ribosome maturation factor RimP